MSHNYDEQADVSSKCDELEKELQFMQKELKITKKKRKKIKKEYKAERSRLKYEVCSSKEELRSLKKKYKRKELRLTEKIENLEKNLQATRLKLLQMQIEYDNYKAITELCNHITELEISNQFQHEFYTIMLRELMPDLYRRYGNKKLFQQQNLAKRLPQHTYNQGKPLSYSRQIIDERPLSNSSEIIDVTYDGMDMLME